MLRLNIQIFREVVAAFYAPPSYQDQRAIRSSEVPAPRIPGSRRRRSIRSWFLAFQINTRDGDLALCQYLRLNARRCALHVYTPYRCLNSVSLRVSSSKKIGTSLSRVAIAPSSRGILVIDICIVVGKRGSNDT